MNLISLLTTEKFIHSLHPFGEFSSHIRHLAKQVVSEKIQLSILKKTDCCLESPRLEGNNYFYVFEMFAGEKNVWQLSSFLPTGDSTIFLKNVEKN